MSDLPSWRQRLHASGLPVRLASAATRREIETAGLFDAAWYVAHAPGAATSGLDPLDHYLTVGARAGRSPGPHFDAAWYLLRYRDVAAQRVDPMLHFIRHGRQEGRDPQALVDPLFDDFQSLGSNCELGLVQRYFGREPLGLFRFSTTPLKGLLLFLRASTDPFLSAPLQVTVADSGEYTVSLQPYGFVFYTGVSSTALPPGEVGDRQSKRLRFLWRKLTEDLEDANQIFIYKSGPRMARSRIEQLALLLRRRGPNHLLWVTPAEAGRPVGTVEIVAPGVMRGYIDRLALDTGIPSYDMWRVICRRAHGLWREQTS